MIQFIDKSNSESAVFPNTPDSDYAKRFFMDMITIGTTSYIKNVDVEVGLLIINDKVIPIVEANLKAKNNCYVASPSAQYVDYCIEELKELKNPPLEKAFEMLLGGIGKTLSALEFNKVVYVNNWLLSTNLYIDLTTEEVLEINQFLSQKFPETMILYRSLNSKTNFSLMQSLTSLGAKRILSRQVYLADPKTGELQEKINFRRDVKLLKTTSLEVQHEDVSIDSAEAVLHQYNQLYIDKYSELNPQFTLDFIKMSITQKLFNFKLVKENGVPVASLGYFERNGLMTPPIFGFNTHAPQNLGLYRILSSLVAQDAEKKGLTVNFSSGASTFKELRGAKPQLEYTYYFYNGCSFKQRGAWSVLSLLANTVGAYLMKRYRL